VGEVTGDTWSIVLALAEDKTWIIELLYGDEVKGVAAASELYIAMMMAKDLYETESAKP
jgi:hypothetical protein